MPVCSSKMESGASPFILSMNVKCVARSSEINHYKSLLHVFSVQECLAELVQTVRGKSMQNIFEASCRIQAKVGVDLKQRFKFFFVRKYVKDRSLNCWFFFWGTLCMKCPKLACI